MPCKAHLVSVCSSPVCAWGPRSQSGHSLALVLKLGWLRLPWQRDLFEGLLVQVSLQNSMNTAVQPRWISSSMSSSILYKFARLQPGRLLSPFVPKSQRMIGKGGHKYRISKSWRLKKKMVVIKPVSACHGGTHWAVKLSRDCVP